MGFYPSLDHLLEQAQQPIEKSTILFETRRSFRSIMSNTIVFLISVLIIIGFTLYSPSGNLIGVFTQKFHLSNRWLGLIPAILLIEIFRKYHDDLYSFKLHNVTHFDGRLSLNYSVPNIRYVDIRAMVVDQDIWGRILDYGNIQLDVAAQEGGEVLFVGIRSPESLIDLIEALRQNSIRIMREEENSNNSIQLDHTE